MPKYRTTNNYTYNVIQLFSTLDYIEYSSIYKRIVHYITLQGAYLALEEPFMSDDMGRYSRNQVFYIFNEHVIPRHDIIKAFNPMAHHTGAAINILKRPNLYRDAYPIAAHILNTCAFAHIALTVTFKGCNGGIFATTYRKQKTIYDRIYQEFFTYMKQGKIDQKELYYIPHLAMKPQFSIYFPWYKAIEYIPEQSE
jgi:hypothetical protein